MLLDFHSIYRGISLPLLIFGGPLCPLRLHCPYGDILFVVYHLWWLVFNHIAYRSVCSPLDLWI